MRGILFFIGLVTVLWSDQVAIFAGGCFWCLQHDLEKVPGVTNTEVGYTGGNKKDPTYKEVSAGGTGHVEAVRIEFDPKTLPYSRLVTIYFHNVDPTRDDGQFCDTGSQYRPVIYYLNPEQEKEAEEVKKSRPVSPNKVEILPAKTFYPAEEYHQHYAEKNPYRYKFYRFQCGRDKRLKEIWG